MVFKSFVSLQNIESRVRAVELLFADKHIKYLKAFQPDNFTKPAGTVGERACGVCGIERLGERACERVCEVERVLLFVGDNDCVLVSIMVPRMGEKCSLFAQLLKEKVSYYCLFPLIWLYSEHF